MNLDDSSRRHSSTRSSARYSPRDNDEASTRRTRAPLREAVPIPIPPRDPNREVNRDTARHGYSKPVASVDPRDPSTSSKKGWDERDNERSDRPKKRRDISIEDSRRDNERRGYNRRYRDKDNRISRGRR